MGLGALESAVVDHPSPRAEDAGIRSRLWFHAARELCDPDVSVGWLRAIEGRAPSPSIEVSPRRRAMALDFGIYIGRLFVHVAATFRRSAIRDAERLKVLRLLSVSGRQATASAATCPRA